MKFYFKSTITRCIISCIVLILLHSQETHAQSYCKGKVINVKDRKPIAFATVAINNAGVNVLSDVFGNFSLLLNAIRNNDSIFISSIGYRSLKLAVPDAMQLKEFILYEEAKDMQPVIIFSKNAEGGSKSEITGYFRAWDTDHTGGEIGKILETGHENFKLEKVRFKVNNRCDTCLLKLHVREVVNGEPGKDLLTESISTMVHHLMFDDNSSEFDLRPYNIIIKKSSVFISMEVLNCSKRAGETCSLSFIGTEQGDYLYKLKSNSDWEEYPGYSIYLKIFYKY